MASRAVRDLVLQQDVERLTIADINMDGARQLADSLPGNNADVVEVDANDHAGMVRILLGYDVAAGAVGPFYKFEKKVTAACIEAGVHYVSICDDHDAVQEVLPLNQQAKEKGIKILNGMGWTPGLSSLLARKGYNELEGVDDINIYWAGSAGDSQGLAVILHTLHIFNGSVPTYRDGKSEMVAAGSGHEPVDFIPPMGRVHTYNLGHPEPITIPLYLPGLKNVSLKGGLREDYLNKSSRLLSKFGLLSNNRRKDLVGSFFNKSLPLIKKLGPRVSYSGIRVDINGYKNSRRTKIIYQVVDHMNNLTGIPFSIGALMLGRGEIERTGVFAPEAERAVNPDAFLQQLQDRGIKIDRREELG